MPSADRFGRVLRQRRQQSRGVVRFLQRLAGIEAKLQQYASWLEREWPGAAASLREGLDELFTVNRLGLTIALRRCLGTTNLIDNGHSAARERMHRVKNWQSGEMALRWTAASFEAASKGFRRIMGYKDIWMLKAILDERHRDGQLARRAVAG